jgi:hypothetical protein
MSGQDTASQGSGADSGGTRLQSDPADVAYRRAWWALSLYPITFVAAFVIGEGLISLLTEDAGDAAFWEVLVAVTPALLVFVIPGILSATQGRKAMRLGRRDGKVPVIVGATIGIGFVGLNILSYIVGLVFG